MDHVQNPYSPGAGTPPPELAGRGPILESVRIALGRAVTSLGPVRANLVSKGMIWSPAHGDTAFTVPRFAGFMRRIIPGQDWRA